MPTDANDEDWLTRKEAADLAGCSQDAIKYTQTKHQLETRTNAAGAILLRTADLVRVGRIRAEDLGAAGSGAECAELVRTKEQVSALRVEVGHLGGRLAERDVLQEVLRQQVAEKDKQLRQAQATLDRLATTLSARSTS
jgi:hypothetical protein